MLDASPRTLNYLAAAVWYIGGFVLLSKGSSLLQEAALLEPGRFWPLLAFSAGLIGGILQARYLFSRNCRKNLARISALKNPKLWQFFRPGFFVALAVMIAGGATLSRLAHDSYVGLLCVGAIDLLVAVSLLGSSVEFWKRGALLPVRVES